MDLLSAAAGDSDAVTWWENDGSESFTAHTLTTTVASMDNARWVRAADVDGDTDPDVLGAASAADDVVWWENTGGGNFTEHLVDGSFNGAYAVVAANLDGDDDVDLVGAAWDADDIVWWENDGSQNFTRRTIDANFDGAYAVHTADVDGDGDVDVLGAADQADDIAWWENDGTPADGGWVEHTVNGSFDGANWVYATDLDGDGDTDVLGTAWQADDVVWWENDGEENFTQHTLSSSFDSAKSAYPADVDGDGDVDVVAAATGADTLAWWENDGEENFTQHTLASSYDGANSVFPIDVDGDGDFDMVSCAYAADDVTWWEQGAPLQDVFLPMAFNNAGPPAAPVLNPIDNPGGNYLYTVSWVAVAGAESYMLEEDEDPGFSSPVTEYSGVALSRLVYAPATGTYFYRVRASNSMGISAWSNTQSAVVTVSPPPCPQTGSWAGTTSHGTAISFGVSQAAGCRVESLQITYRANCTGGTVLRTEFLGGTSISNNHFSTSGVSGDFTSMVEAAGSFSKSFTDPVVGWCTGSGTWSASYTP